MATRFDYIKKILNLSNYAINPMCINPLIAKLDINNNTKNLIVCYFKSFYKWLNITFHLELEPSKINKYEKQAINKQALSKDELHKIYKLLKKY